MTLGWFELTLWAAAVSFLGVFMAIPMKRQQINIEQLPFPSGIATAETLTAMHTQGVDAERKAWGLSISAAIGGVIGWLRDAHAKWMPFNIPGDPLVPAWTLSGQPLSRLTIGFEPSLIMVGAGAIMGIRAGISLLVSAIVCYGLVGPYVLNHGWVDPNVFRQKWALWPGVGLLVTSGLTGFFWRWRTIVRAFGNLGKLVTGRGGEEEDPLRDIEAPQKWFLWGTLVSGAACIVLGMLFFQITWWMGVLAVVATFFLALVASRATGETDITPTGAMGKITQLIYGVLAPGNMTTNLMTASITGGAAIHAADLLTDLKSGYILGANPRKQLIAQLWGVVAGTVFVVPAYFLLDQAGGDRQRQVARASGAGVGGCCEGARQGTRRASDRRARRLAPRRARRDRAGGHRGARAERKEEVHALLGRRGDRVGHPRLQQLLDVPRRALGLDLPPGEPAEGRALQLGGCVGDHRRRIAHLGAGGGLRAAHVLD